MIEMWTGAIALWGTWTMVTRENDSLTLQLAGLTALGLGAWAVLSRLPTA